MRRLGWTFAGLVATALAVAWFRISEPRTAPTIYGSQWALTALLLAASGVGVAAATVGWRRARGGDDPRWPWLVPLVLFAFALVPSAEPTIGLSDGNECTDMGFLPAALYKPVGRLTHGPPVLVAAAVGVLGGAAGLFRRDLRPPAAWALAGGLWHVALSVLHVIAVGCYGM